MIDHPQAKLVFDKGNLSADELIFFNQIDTDIVKQFDDISVLNQTNNQSKLTDEVIVAEVIVTEPPTKKRKLDCPQIIKYNLKEIVSAHPIGDALLKISEARQKFTTLHQSYLVELITIHFYTIGV